jgi:hypothetical protein
LEFAEYHPTAQLVEQCRLHATVQPIDPTLVFARRTPTADNLVAILVELHSQAVLVCRITAEAVVTLFVNPRIYDFSHIAY